MTMSKPFHRHSHKSNNSHGKLAFWFWLTLVAASFMLFTLNHQYNSLQVFERQFHGVNGVSLLHPDQSTTTALDLLSALIHKNDKLEKALELANAEKEELRAVKGQTNPRQQQEEHRALTNSVIPNVNPIIADASSSNNDPCYMIRRDASVQPHGSTFAISAYGASCKHRVLTEQPPALSVATIIPGLAREPDFSFFPTVLQSMQEQTIPNDEVIIVISGVFHKVSVRYAHYMPTEFDEDQMKRTNKFCQDALNQFTKILTKSPIKLICIGERLTSGRARNVGIRAASSDILAFIDSDDTAYPFRTEVIKNVFNDDMECRRTNALNATTKQAQQQQPLLMFLHSYQSFKAHKYEADRGYSKEEGIQKNKILPNNAWTGKQCLEQEEGLITENGHDFLRRVINKPSAVTVTGLYNIAHGHPVIRRSVFDIGVQFTGIPKGEDGLLVREIIYQVPPMQAKNAILYVDRPLTTYSKAGKANRDLMK